MHGQRALRGIDVIFLCNIAERKRIEQVRCVHGIANIGRLIRRNRRDVMRQRVLLPRMRFRRRALPLGHEPDPDQAKQRDQGKG